MDKVTFVSEHAEPFIVKVLALFGLVAMDFSRGFDGFLPMCERTLLIY